MAQVQVTILGRSYSLDCEIGQEYCLTQLAEQLNHRLNRMSQRMPETSDYDLLVMLSLTLLDELNEKSTNKEKESIEQYRSQLSSIADRLDRLNRLVITTEEIKN